MNDRDVGIAVRKYITLSDANNQFKYLNPYNKFMTLIWPDLTFLPEELRIEYTMLLKSSPTNVFDITIEYNFDPYSGVQNTLKNFVIGSYKQEGFLKLQVFRFDVSMHKKLEIFNSLY